VKYEADYSRVVATIPTRALETFAPFLPLPESETTVPAAAE
jgi:hypothetical protein